MGTSHHMSHPGQPCSPQAAEGHQKEGHSLEEAQDEGVGSWATAASFAGARRLTWLYRVPRERVLEPEDTGRCQPDPSPALRPVPHSPFTWLHRRLHHTPGLLRRCPVMRSFPERLQPWLATRSMEGRTEGGQHQVPHHLGSDGYPNWA